MFGSKIKHCLGLLGTVLVITMYLPEVTANKTAVNIDLNDPKVQQRIRLFNVMRECFSMITNVTAPSDGGLYCPPVWDNILCWTEYVPAGTLVAQRCPGYVHRFNQNERAFRKCTDNGTWEKHPDQDIDRHYTDFAKCNTAKLPTILVKHMSVVTRVATIGYSISIAALVLAIFILVFFKKLHCQRNTIHINLFASFLVRAVISVIRNSIMVEGLALSSDLIYEDGGTLNFKPEGLHWECKLLNTLWLYALVANYFWIFVEGLYLHTLIFFAVFSQTKQFFKIYIITGWVLPSIFIMIWVLVRAFKNNELCWSTHTKGFYWILEGPMILTLFVNFFFFLNIVRVLFTKIRDCNTRDPKRYKKLAKSTLVLIPMFGVYYLVFIILSRIDNHIVSLLNICIELPINSIQGVVVAMLFCFLNGEVQAEIMKRWDRHRLRSQSMTSGRSSRAFSTGSFYMGRDRTSVCMGTMSTLANTPGDSEGNGSSPRASAEPRDPFKELKDKNTDFENITLSENHHHLPRVPSSPKVSFRSQDLDLANSFDISNTSYPHGDAKKVPDCIKDCVDQRPARAPRPQDLPSGVGLEEERLVLIPSENSTESRSNVKQNGNCLSLVRGGEEGENKNGVQANIAKISKGKNADTGARQPKLTGIDRLSDLDDVTTDESQLILT